MIRPTDDDADFKMMSTPDEWPQWPVLPLKRSTTDDRGRVRREVGVLINTSLFDDTKTHFMPNHSIFSVVRDIDLTDENRLTPEKARQLVNEGWKVD